MEMFLYNGHLLLIKSLLSFLIEGGFFLQELLLIVSFHDFDIDKNVAGLFVSLGVVNFESIDDPLNVFAFLADDHSLLVL